MPFLWRELKTIDAVFDSKHLSCHLLPMGWCYKDILFPMGPPGVITGFHSSSLSSSLLIPSVAVDGWEQNHQSLWTCCLSTVSSVKAGWAALSLLCLRAWTGASHAGADNKLLMDEFDTTLGAPSTFLTASLGGGHLTRVCARGTSSARWTLGERLDAQEIPPSSLRKILGAIRHCFAASSNLQIDRFTTTC